MTYLKKEKPITKEEFDKKKFSQQGWKFKNEKMVIFNRKITYEQLVENLVRGKFSVSAELGILRQRDEKPEEFNAYNIYVEECKTKAKAFIEERKLWML